jgi:hypothetical protein
MGKAEDAAAAPIELSTRKTTAHRAHESADRAHKAADDAHRRSTELREQAQDLHREALGPLLVRDQLAAGPLNTPQKFLLIH